MSHAESQHAWINGLRSRITDPLPCYDQADNYATYRYGPQPPDQSASLKFWHDIVMDARVEAFHATHSLLEDEESRSILEECLTFNALGWRHHKRRQNTEEYRVLAASLPYQAPRYPVVLRRLKALRHKFIDVYAIPELDLRVITSDGFILCKMMCSQYTLQRGDVRVGVDPGDVVLDCGACWGDTSVHFAHEVGPEGKVYAFEFVPSNLDLVAQNLALNPRLKGRIVTVKHPVSDRSGQTVAYQDDGPSTRMFMKAQPGTPVAHTLSIDDLVAKHVQRKVDYIKMDIEGAEPLALKGAADTLRRDRPKLAISAYHRPDDLVALPALIKAIEPGYRFWLDHHTIHNEETVLYARCDER